MAFLLENSVMRLKSFSLPITFPKAHEHNVASHARF